MKKAKLLKMSKITDTIDELFYKRYMVKDYSLDECIDITFQIYNYAQNKYPNTVKKLLMFSGGNDSLVMLDVLKDHIDSVVHINTGIGIAKTRDFVRKTCNNYNLDLIEETPDPENSYVELIKRYGFPGPGQHRLMYARLKERQIRSVNRKFVTNGRKQRVQFFTGVRVDESSRRWKTSDEIHREGSFVWISPLIHWSNENMAEYKKTRNLPLNEVSINLHMSGECLCGSFAKKDEFEQIKFFYPEDAAYIEELQELIKDCDVKYKKWGWREDHRRIKNRTGILCSSCDFNYES
jgi:3'-phosphoadenosine 5'-phosphosulfate sulfotransferase (PAPS reductase)/FAD synthetase